MEPLVKFTRDYALSFKQTNGVYTHITDLDSYQTYNVPNHDSVNPLHFSSIMAIMSESKPVNMPPALSVKQWLNNIMATGKNYSIFFTGFDYDPFTAYKTPQNQSWTINPHIMMAPFAILKSDRLNNLFSSGKVTRICYYDIVNSTRYVYETGFVSDSKELVENMFVQAAVNATRHEFKHGDYKWQLSDGWHYFNQNYMIKSKSIARDKQFQMSPETFYPHSLMYHNETTNDEMYRRQIELNCAFFRGLDRMESFTTLKHYKLNIHFPQIKISSDITTMENNWSKQTKLNLCKSKTDPIQNDPDNTPEPTPPSTPEPTPPPTPEPTPPPTPEPTVCDKDFAEFKGKKIMFRGSKILGPVVNSQISLTSINVTKCKDTAMDIQCHIVNGLCTRSTINISDCIIGSVDAGFVKCAGSRFKGLSETCTITIKGFEATGAFSESLACISGPVVKLDDASKQNNINIEDPIIASSNSKSSIYITGCKVYTTVDSTVSCKQFKIGSANVDCVVSVEGSIFL